MVILVHGLGEHSGKYGKLIKILNEQGFAVYIFDWPGHGKSGGKRGTCNHRVGYGLGGLTVIRYAETRPEKIRGVVASSPALVKSPKTPSFMVTLAKVLGKIALGLTLSNGIDPKLLSRNPEAVRKYIEDPLVHDRISAKLGMSVFNNMELAHKEAHRINVPVLLLVGTGDVITPPEGSRKLFEELKVDDKTLKEFEGAYHEIFEDPEWEEDFHRTIVEWSVQHAKK